MEWCTLMLDRTDPARIRMECLEEENRQLHERIAELEGGDIHRDARSAFGLTASQARIFCLLYRLRSVEYDYMMSAVYDMDSFDGEDASECIRSHMKRLRAKVRPYGIDFKAVYGYGFEMSNEAHAAATLVLETLEDDRSVVIQPKIHLGKRGGARVKLKPGEIGPRQEELLSYFIGLGPVGTPVEMARKTLMQDLGWLDFSSFFHSVNKLIQAGYIRRIACSDRTGTTGLFVVLKRGSL